MKSALMIQVSDDRVEFFRTVIGQLIPTLQYYELLVGSMTTHPSMSTPDKSSTYSKQAEYFESVEKWTQAVGCYKQECIVLKNKSLRLKENLEMSCVLFFSKLVYGVHLSMDNGHFCIETSVQTNIYFGPNQISNNIHLGKIDQIE